MSQRLGDCGPLVGVIRSVVLDPSNGPDGNDGFAFIFRIQQENFQLFCFPNEKFERVISLSLENMDEGSQGFVNLFV